MTELILDVQRASGVEAGPAYEDIQSWVKATLAGIGAAEPSYEVSVRMVSQAEMAQFNQQYRGKQGATNVLSFPFEAADFMLEAGMPRLLGDILVCPAVVQAEAQAQHKTLMSHWAHIIIHGTLHLLGYDHENEAQAQEMENTETQILARFHIADPYLIANPS